MFGKVKRWFIDWLYREFCRKEQLLAWQSSAQLRHEQEGERQTDRIAMLTTIPVKSVRVPAPVQHQPGPTTNVLRQYGQTYGERPLKLYRRAKKDGKL